MGIFRHKRTKKDFWTWFQENEGEIFESDATRDSIFDELHSRLQEFHESLTFEISNVRNDGTRDLVISADGIRDAFPAVLELTEKAPRFKRFQITAFRQPHLPLAPIRMGDKEFKPEHVHFSLEEEEDELNIYVFMKDIAGASEQDCKRSLMAMYLFLDQALGEYVVETRLSAITLLDFDEHAHIEKLPLSDLPAAIAKNAS